MTDISSLFLTCYVVLQVSDALQPPSNLSIISENFKHILTWDDPNNESSIYYRVDYSEQHQRYQTAEHCSNISTRRCDLTWNLTDIDSTYQIRVLSFTRNISSRASRIIDLTPAQDTVLGPPVVDIVPGDQFINVSIQPPVSHLWSEELQEYNSIRSVFPSMEYIIKVEHMNEQVPVPDVDIEEVNYILIPNLLPNSNYCVSVSITMESVQSKHPSIPSKPKCVVTDPHAKGLNSPRKRKLLWTELKAAKTEIVFLQETHLNNKGDITTYIIVSVICGVLLLIGIVFSLIGLDIAGYICRARTLIPKVLKSIPVSESTCIDGSGFTSPTFSIPEEIISEKLAVEHKPQSEDKHCEGGYANRKRLLDSDTSGTMTSGELPSVVSSSIGSSGQTASSVEEDLPAEMLEDGVFSAVSVARLPVVGIEDSSNLPFDTSGVFNINLNSVCIANPAVVWTGFGSGELPQKMAPDLVESQEAGIVLDKHIDICLGIDGLEEEICRDDDEEEEDIYENKDAGSCLISGYMRR